MCLITQQPSSLQATIDAGTADTTAFLSQLRGQIMQDQRIEAQMKAQIDAVTKERDALKAENDKLKAPAATTTAPAAAASPAAPTAPAPAQ
jgi:cell division protein FtsB